MIHIIQVIKTGWNNFSGMVRGFEVIDTSDILPDTIEENNQQ
jgi:hypothetical protein